MLFGFSAALAKFQRIMDMLIQGSEMFTAAYLDELVVYSPSWQEHYTHF